MTGWLVILRPLFMWIATTRFAWLAQPAIAARWVGVAAIGHPATALISVVWVLVGGLGLGLVWAVVGAWAVEKLVGLAVWQVALWQKVWSTKRRWPTQYATVDYATQDVQASFGGSGGGFLRSSKRLSRPILGAPALSPVPRIDWGAQTATWGIHANAGQTLPALAKVVDALSGAYYYVYQVTVDFQNPGDSIGSIRFHYQAPIDNLETPEVADLRGARRRTPAPPARVPEQPPEREPGGDDDGLGSYDGTVDW